MKKRAILLAKETTEHTEHTDPTTVTPYSRLRNPTLRSIIWTTWAFSVPVGFGAPFVGSLGLSVVCTAIWCATSLYLVLLPSRHEDAENPNDRRMCTKSFLWASVVISDLSLLVLVVDAWAPRLLNGFPGLLAGLICFALGLPLLPSLSVFVLAHRRFLFNAGSRRATALLTLFALFCAVSWFFLLRMCVNEMSSI